jgi:hypothetical protein
VRLCIVCVYELVVGRDNVVGIATPYGLDGRVGSNPGGGEIFVTSPDQLWGSPVLLYYGYRVILHGGKVAGAWHCSPSPFER